MICGFPEGSSRYLALKATKFASDQLPPQNYLGNLCDTKKVYVENGYDTANFAGLNKQSTSTEAPRLHVCCLCLQVVRETVTEVLMPGHSPGTQDMMRWPP